MTDESNAEQSVEKSHHVAQFIGDDMANDTVQQTPFTPEPAVVPAPPPHFTGRRPHLDALKTALGAGGATPITALQGMGGIGKTATALKLTQEVADAYPGGVFWADLPRHAGNPRPVLRRWARCCAHDLAAEPDLNALANQVRDLLAARRDERGPLLALVDDVREEWLAGAQMLQAALPLGIPALVTTREMRVARALRAYVIQLDTLAEAEARELLTALTAGVLSGDQADRVAALCGYLPLALELAAGAATIEGGDWLLRRLEAATTRLDALQLEDAERREQSLRLIFAVSYAGLAERQPETARVFACLSVFAPAPIDPVRLAGVLAEMDKDDEQREIERLMAEFLGEVPAGAEVEAAQVEAADEHLRRLVRWGLLLRLRSPSGGPSSTQEAAAEPKHSCGRYVLHPLLRDYAAERLAGSGAAEATHAAHLAHYLAYAEAHDQPTASDYDALEAARPDILIAMDRAYQGECWPDVCRLAWALTIDGVSGYLPAHGYRGEMRTRLAQAVHAALAKGQGHEAAAFAGNLAALLIKIGDLDAARQEQQRVLAIFEEMGELRSVAVAYHQLGVRAQATGELDEARRLHRQGLRIKGGLGNRASIARSLHELGRLAQAKGALDEARRLYCQSLEVKERLGDRAGVASSLHQLGILAQATGELDEARRLYRQSLGINEGLGNRAGIAQTLGELGSLAYRRDDQVEAEKLYRQAMAIQEEIGDVVNASIWMFNLALLCEDQGRLEEALPLLERAVHAFERAGSPHAYTVRYGLERVRGKLKE